MKTQEKMGCQIKKLREEQNLSQTELAHMVGYKDKTAIAKIEAGKVDLPQSKIFAFSKALNTEVSSLFDTVSSDDCNDVFLYKHHENLPNYVRELGEFLYYNPNHKKLIEACMRIAPEDIELAEKLLNKISGYSLEE